MDGFDRRGTDRPRLRGTLRVEPALTLFDLVSALRRSGASDVEVVSTVADLVARGRLRLARDLDGADVNSVWAIWKRGRAVDPTTRSYNEDGAVRPESGSGARRPADGRPSVPRRAPSEAGTPPARTCDRASFRGDRKGDER